MSLRTNNYVPSETDWTKRGNPVVPIERESASTTVLVNEGGTTVRRNIAMALPDELNRDSDRWWWADYSGDEGDHWSHFEGHRVIVDIDIRQSNRRVVNDWKGYDEIRKSTMATVYFDQQPVWEEVGGDIRSLLLNLDHNIQRLLGLYELVKYVKGDASSLIGREIMYRDLPATISSFIGSQGCVMIDPDPGPWPDIASLRYYDESGMEAVKVEILSPHINWFRPRGDD